MSTSPLSYSLTKSTRYPDIKINESHNLRPFIDRTDWVQKYSWNLG